MQQPIEQVLLITAPIGAAMLLLLRKIRIRLIDFRFGKTRCMIFECEQPEPPMIDFDSKPTRFLGTTEELLSNIRPASPDETTHARTTPSAL